MSDHFNGVTAGIPSCRIERLALFQHGHQDSMPTVSECSQSSPVGMTVRSQVRVVRSATFVTYRGDTRPVVKRVAKSVVAASSHYDNSLASALAGDRSDSGIGTQRFIVAISDGLRCFGQKRTCYNASNSGQRSQYRYVRWLFRCFGCVYSRFSHLTSLLSKTAFWVELSMGKQAPL